MYSTDNEKAQAFWKTQLKLALERDRKLKHRRAVDLDNRRRHRAKRKRLDLVSGTERVPAKEAS